MKPKALTPFDEPSDLVQPELPLFPRRVSNNPVGDSTLLQARHREWAFRQWLDTEVELQGSDDHLEGNPLDYGSR